jgi:hypothetical protein
MFVVVIAIFVAIFGLGVEQRASAGVVIGVVFGLGVVLFLLAGLRNRRVTAWARGEVPGEFRDAPTAWATITSVRVSGERYGSQPVLRCQVRVDAIEGAFTSLMEVVLTGRQPVRFVEGASYPVRYLPDDHSLVAYDTTSAAANLGPKPTVSPLPDLAAIGYSAMSESTVEPSFIVDQAPPTSAPTSYEQYPANSTPSAAVGFTQALPPQVAALMQEMLADRLTGKALVTAQRATGQLRGLLAEVELDLTVTPQTGAPFDTTVTKWVPSSLTGRLQPGTIVDVSYSPGSPSDVSIVLTTISTSTELLG